MMTVKKIDRNVLINIFIFNNENIQIINIIFYFRSIADLKVGFVLKCIFLNSLIKPSKNV